MPATEQRIALVTGANRGIGLEISRQLAALGLLVLLGIRDPEKGRRTEEELRRRKLDARWRPLDVADPVSVRSATSRILDEFGRIDVLVNNAGILIDPHRCVLELDPVTLHNTLQTNAVGPLLLSQACIPAMRTRGYGRVVNVASGMGALGEMADPGSPHGATPAPAYRLSKTLLLGLTILLARAAQRANGLVNAACPGWVRTDMGGEEAPRSAAQGADTPVWLATLPDHGPSGGFFRDREPIPW